MQINIDEARRALTEKPMFATSAERVLILDEIKSKYNSLPQPKRFSAMLSELLSRVSVPIEDHDLIVGRCVDRELTEDEEKIFQKYIKHPDNPNRLSLLSSGHSTISWEMILQKGLSGLKAEVSRSAKDAESEEKRVFFSSMLEAYEAIEGYILRYADSAESKGLTAVAKNLRASVNAPDSFYSALQLFWILTLINCAYITPNPTFTLGRLDKLLYPLYKADIESGRMTKDNARRYITDYYCKHNLIMGRGEHQIGDSTNSTTFDRIFNFDAPQYLLLAGKDEDGNPSVNELTELFAECIVPEFKNPVVVVRYFGGLNEQFPTLWKTLIKKAIASSSMMFYNDDNVQKTLARYGIPKEDLCRYEHFGCNWPSLGDDSAWLQNAPHSKKFGVYTSKEEEKQLDIPFMKTNTAHGWPEDLLIVLRELEGRAEISMDEIYDKFFARMADFIDRKLEWSEHETKARKRRPSALLSFRDLFSRSSIERGECLSACAKYHFNLHSFYMFGTVSDCFTVIDRLVVREKRLTLSELLAATDANFVGYEETLALVRSVDKYGSDEEISNGHAAALAKRFSDLVIEKSRITLERSGVLLVSCLQSDTWHIKLGELFGATPNGRLANTPFSQNSRPSNGAAKNGLTAMLNSMLNLPSDGFLSGALNLDIDNRQFAGERGETMLSVLLGSYFNAGGLHAQVSCTSADDLIDAKENPTCHRDIRVRVTGYSGIFVDMPEKLQNDIIERLK